MHSSNSNDSSQPSVVLGRLGEPVIVRGKVKPRLTRQGYKVVKALLAAGERGLSKEELEGLCPTGRRILRTLREDEDWDAVIQMAGRPGRPNWSSR